MFPPSSMHSCPRKPLTQLQAAPDACQPDLQQEACTHCIWQCTHQTPCSLRAGVAQASQNMKLPPTTGYGQAYGEALSKGLLYYRAAQSGVLDYAYLAWCVLQLRCPAFCDWLHPLSLLMSALTPGLPEHAWPAICCVSDGHQQLHGVPVSQ